jgi:uncharacterized protein (DUF302 family)
MLQIRSVHRLEHIEAVLRQVAQRQGASVLSVTHLGQCLSDQALDPLVFTLWHSELYAALLAADARFAAILPCRIAACSGADGVTLAAVSPRDCCRLVDRADVDPLTEKLETVLCRIMKEAALPLAAAAAARPGSSPSALGAVEDQVNMRAALPQRIDCRGSKVEELGGTGTHDSLGG